MQFDSGEEANRIARRNNEHNALYGGYHANTRYRVRKVVDTDDDNYVAREAALNHTPVPWEISRYQSQWILPHIDPANPHMVRMFRSLEDAIEGKYTSMKVSRFLSTYEDFDDAETQKILVDMGVYGEQTFAVTQDPVLIQEVYENGPSSCMNDPDEYELPSDPHPVAVYGHGDLGLAYMGNGVDYSARAVVWPEKKIFSCYMYGHETLLRSKLIEAGYRQADTKEFIGARIGAITENGGSEYIMPYVDLSGYANLTECGKFFELTGNSGQYEIRVTCGYAELDSYYRDDDYEEDY